MLSLFARSNCLAANLFALTIAFLSLCLNYDRVYGSEGTDQRRVMTELIGLDRSLVVQETMRIDYRPLTSTESDGNSIDMEWSYDLELNTAHAFERLSILLPGDADVARLILDSSSLSFKSDAVDASSVDWDYAIDQKEWSNLKQCSFDAEIGAGKHRLVVGVKMPVRRTHPNRYEVTLLTSKEQIASGKDLRVQYAVPDNWQFAIESTSQNLDGKAGQIFVDRSSIKGALTFAAIENNLWQLSSKATILPAYEFDRRFSITGHVFLIGIAIVSLVAGAVVWFQGGSRLAYGCLLGCGALAAIGLASAYVLPESSNQMRVVRQQDHDELIMIANRLLLEHMRRESKQSQDRLVSQSPIQAGGSQSSGADQENAEDISACLISLMRQSKVTQLGDCYVETKEATSSNIAPKDSENSYRVSLRDSPTSSSLYDVTVRADNSIAIQLVSTEPVPTRLRLGQVLGGDEATPRNKSATKDAPPAQ